MGTITLPNFRVSGTDRARVRLKDGGVYMEWSTMTDIKAWLYSVDQKAISGRFDVQVDPQDGTRLVCVYSAQKPQYLGVNKIILQCKYDGAEKTYDKPLWNFVRWTGDQDGEEVTIDDPVVDVEIVVEDVSSSLLDEAIRAAFTAAEEAVDAKGQVLETEAEVEAAEALRVSAEESRVEAEEGRAEAEAARVDEEAVRVSAEDARVVAENARAAAEDLREGAEDDRAAAETARETAEAARVAAEALRVTAEGSRETAEAAREAQASADHTVAAGDHTQAAADHTQAAADHTTAASDHTQAGADHTLAAADHVTAGEDHEQAQDDHEVMAGYDTRLTNAETEVSQLEAKVDELYDSINGATQEETIEQPLTANSYYNTNNSPLSYETATLQGNYCCRLPVVPGEKYRITGNGSGTIYVLLYATTDSDNYAIRKASTDIDYRTNPAEITIQQGEAFLYVNLSDYNSQTDKVEKITEIFVNGIKQKIENIEDEIDSINEEVSNINNQDREILKFEPGVYVDLSGGVGSVVPQPELSYDYDYCRRSVNEGDKIIINGNGGTTERLWGVVDKENRILSVASPNATGTDLEIVAPANSVAVIVNSSNTSVPSYYVSKKVLSERITDNFNGISNNEKQIAIVRSNTESREILGYSKQMDEYVIDRVGVVGPIPGYNAFVRYYDVSGQKIVHISFDSPLTQSGVFCAYAIYESDVPGTSPIAYGHRLVGSYEMDVIIPDGGRYIGVQLNIYYDTLSVYGFTPLIKSLTGKRVVCFGDSLTEFEGAYDNKTYPQHIAEITGAEVINVGIGGTRLGCRVSPVLIPTNETEGYAALDCPSLIDAVATQDFTIVDAGALWVKNNVSDDNTPIIARLKAIDWSKVDIVTFFIGTNDWYGWGQYGNPGDISKLSVLGGINYIIQTLLTAYPHLSIYWFTPIVRWIASNLSERINANWGGVYEVNGRTLEEFSDGIASEVKSNGIPVCDMYHTLGWNKFNFSQYFLDTDGVHPYKGFRQIANKMTAFIYANRNF